MPPSLNPLQTLLDKEEIRDVLLRYARGADRLDVDMFHSVFWDDGGYEDSVVEGCAKEFIPTLIGDTVRSLFAVTQHFITNMRVQVTEPDLAFAESYFLAFHLTNPGKEALDATLGARRMQELGGDYSRSYELIVAGRYLDRFEKRGQTWRIKTRRLVSEWTSAHHASGIGREGLGQLWQLTGRRDRTDPSYRSSLTDSMEHDL
jgi:hypothetical protein